MVIKKCGMFETPECAVSSDFRDPRVWVDT